MDRSQKRWNTGDVGYPGLFSACSSRASMSYGMFFQGNLPSEDPLVHITIDLIADTLGVAGLFGSVSSLRNWLMWV
jgi:hypothetical protein